MSRSYADQRRLLYAVDRGVRARRKNEALKAQNLPPKHIETRDSWTRGEVCDAIGVSQETFIGFVSMGVVPKATYPGRQTRYWSHQVPLLIDLFTRMRHEGWPKRIPHFVGSAYWTDYLAKLQSEWTREPRLYAEWKARGGNDNETGEDRTGERAGV
jgi:hypothetical protein